MGYLGCVMGYTCSMTNQHYDIWVCLKMDRPQCEWMDCLSFQMDNLCIFMPHFIILGHCHICRPLVNDPILGQNPFQMVKTAEIFRAMAHPRHRNSDEALLDFISLAALDVGVQSDGVRWIISCTIGQPLVNSYSELENHHFKSNINYKWVIFNSYIRLPGGTFKLQMIGWFVGVFDTFHW